MSILERLKKETQELHETVQNSLPFMRFGFEFSEYRRLIARFYGFYLPVENKINGVPHLEATLPDWRKRRKTEWLLKDLYALGCTAQEIAHLPFCSKLPPLSVIPEFLGCLYVLEGSTLGGKIISRHLRATLGLGPDNGGAFFCGYAGQVGPMWKAFQCALSVAIRFEEQDQTINAAKQTFHCLYEWLKTE